MLSLNLFIDDGKEMDPRQSVYLNGRAVWGSHIYDLETYGEMRADFLKSLAAMQELGGLLLVPFTGQAERSLLIFLNIIAGGLIHEGKRVHCAQFLDTPALSQPKDYSVWLIYQADAYPDLQMRVEDWLAPGRVAILAGLGSALSPSAFNAPAELFLGFESFSDDDGRAKEVIESDRNILTNMSEQRKQRVSMPDIHRQVALCDAWGVSLPLGLLACCLNMEEDELAPMVEELYQAGKEGILYWVEREKPPTLMVSTRSEDYARRFLTYLAGSQNLTLKEYLTLLDAAQPALISERYALLQLFLGMLAHVRFRSLLGENFNIAALRDFVFDSWKTIHAAIEAGSSAEHLLWGLCLLRLGLLEKSWSVLTQGIKLDKNNIYLQQALARLLGIWSQIDNGKREEAEKAFQQAVKIDKKNIYVWQAWGVFAAEQANWQRAEYCFQNALALNDRSVFVLAARANMYLDMGQIEKAETDLLKAVSEDAGNFHRLHLLGRIHCWRGNWEQASRQWHNMLEKDKRNVFAAQSLGHLARMRGQWQDSRAYLDFALDNDPENVACLLEVGLLRQDMGTFALSDEARRRELDEALICFERALQIAPWNPKIIVSFATAERLAGKTESAANRLDALLRRLPDNDYAGHALALCDRDLGRETAMTARLRAIHDARRGRNLPVLFSLIEIMIKNGQTDDARQVLQDVVRHKIRDMAAIKRIETLLEAARLFVILDDKTAATEAIEEAKRIDPDNLRISWFMERWKI